MQVKNPVRIAALSLLSLFIIPPIYADDAEKYCKETSTSLAPVRGGYSEAGNGCNNNKALNHYCSQIAQSENLTPNCQMTNYTSENNTSDTVAQCTGIAAQPEGNQVIYKYVLCQDKHNNQLVWSKMIDNSSINLPQAINQP